MKARKKELKIEDETIKNDELIESIKELIKAVNEINVTIGYLNIINKDPYTPYITYEPYPLNTSYFTCSSMEVD